MSDRVFPASKPAAATTNGTAPAAANANNNANPPATKSNLYNPMARPQYRPQPHHRRHNHRRNGRSLCCCCCFWTILLLLILALLAAIAGTALYVLYHPKQPVFSIPSLRIHRLNLTTSADSSTSHLSTLFNLTLISKNPNSHLDFSYDPFMLSCYSSTSGVLLGNGTLPAFFSDNKNQTAFRAVVLSSTASDLDAESLTGLRSDLKKKAGLSLKIQMDTKVKVKMGGLKSKKVGIRVICEGIKGAVPKGKAPSVASTADSKCKVDLRVKIWKWTF